MKTNKTLTKILLFAVFAFLKANSSVAQAIPGADNSDVAKQVAALKPGESNFMMVGLVTFGFVNQNSTFTPGGATDKQNSIGDVDRFEFSPMFLWRHGDKLLAELCCPGFNCQRRIYCFAIWNLYQAFSCRMDQ